jgi:hypothetical protein
MEFLKSTAGKIITGVVALAVVATAISWFQMDPATRQTLLTGTGRIVSWLLAVILLPWATFFVSGWAAKFDTNTAGAILVAGYTLLEAVGLAWLFHWKISSGTAWTFLIVGALFAGVYNLFTCDWIAEKSG